MDLIKVIAKDRCLRFFRWTTIAFILSLVIASCVSQVPQALKSGDALAPASAGNTPGEITIYTALEDDQIAKYLPLFEKAHPEIKVNKVRDSTGVVTAKLIAEKDNPKADAVWGLAVSSLLILDQQGMLEPFAPKSVENVNPRFKDSRTPPHWVGIDVWMTAFCVNTAEMKKRQLPIPQSWADLAKPEYKGMIVMSNPASSGTGFLSVSSILQIKGEKEGWAFLDALDKNIAQYVHSGSKPCKIAGSGEYPIGISFDYRAVKQKNAGEPIAAVFPTEGSGWDIEANALIKKPEIKPAAKTFLDWAISPEISRLYAENFPVTAVKTDVPIPKGYPADPLNQLSDKVDFNWAAKNRESILDEWTRRFDAKSEPKKS